MSVAIRKPIVSLIRKNEISFHESSRTVKATRVELRSTNISMQQVMLTRARPDISSKLYLLRQICTIRHVLSF